MTNKKIKFTSKHIPDKREKPRERKPDLGKFLGAAVLLSACGKGKPKDYPKKSMLKIVDNEDGTQTIIRPEKSVSNMFGDFTKADAVGLAYDAAFIAIVLLTLRLSKFGPPKADKSRDKDRG